MSKPRLTPTQKTVLQYVQDHPGQRTDDLTMQLGMPFKRLRSVLYALHAHKLVGHQESLLKDMVSTWWPETVEEEN